MKIHGNLKSNEVLLFKMFHVFPHLMLTKFYKLFYMWENWDWGVSSPKSHSQQLVKQLKPSRGGFQHASHYAPLPVELW